MGSTMYLEQLAIDLVAHATNVWFEPQATFAGVMNLAFNYLDTDNDEALGVADLMEHVSGETAREQTHLWIYRWSPPHLGDHRGLSISDFRLALLSVCASNTTRCLLTSEDEDIVQTRFRAIDEICQQMVDADESLGSALGGDFP